jgi:hypothetical protein
MSTNGSAITKNSLIAVHPDVLGHVVGELTHPTGKTILETAQRGAQALYDAHEQIGAAVEAVQLDTRARGAVDANLLERFRAANERVFDRAAKAHQQALDALGNIRASLSKEIEQSYTIPDDHGVEIRAHLQRAPIDARIATITGAIDRGDKATVTAISRGPGYLSGLTDDQQSSFRQRAGERFAPDAHAAFTAATRAHAHLEDAGKAFNANVTALVDLVRPTPQSTEAAGAIARMTGAGDN